MHPSNQANRAAASGGPFAKRPRAVLVWILEFFTMYEVASLQRLVCREFRDAGQLNCMNVLSTTRSTTTTHPTPQRNPAWEKD